MSTPPPNELFAKGWSGEPGHAAAVAFWSSLGLRVDDEEFREAGAETRALAVTITGIGELRLIQAFKDAVGKGLERDLSADEVKEQLCEELNAERPGGGGKEGQAGGKGSVSAFDLEVLYGYEEHLDSEIRTSMSRARHAGLWREVHLKALGECAGPLLRYSADLRGSACEGHRSLHGLVRTHDDPVWREFLPPNGPGCGCSVKAVDPSQACAMGLSLTSDWKLAEMRAGLRGDVRTGFAPAEDPLLAIADALTWKYKNSESSIEQHRRNAVEWEGFHELGAALRKRYEGGVDVFAVEKHGVSSRGEMSIDIAVMPSHMPKNLGGRVVLVTDTGYKTILRELVRKTRNHLETQSPSRNVCDSELVSVVRGNMKSVMSGWIPGKTVAVSMTGLYVGTASDHVWIKFNSCENDSMHYYEMSKGLYIYNFDSWVRKNQKRNKSFGVVEIQETPATRQIQ